MGNWDKSLPHKAIAYSTQIIVDVAMLRLLHNVKVQLPLGNWVFIQVDYLCY